jgi:predicted metal-dependent phosphotriesterase family hydrolase
MARNGPTTDSIAIETVTGPVAADGFTSALAHEHLFVDFLGPADPRYLQVDWADVRSACEERLAPVRATGVDLLVDCTCIGVGRHVDLLRAVSASTGIRIACATGIYKALRPPVLRDATVDELADLFVRELTVGIDGGEVRAGFVKLATTEDGPTEDETLVHRAGAIAGVATGATIVLHSPRSDVADTVLRTLEREGFDPARLVWAHAQESTLEENLALAARGVTVSLDAIGTSDDAEMLRRIERFAEAGWDAQVMVSSDSSLVVHPTELAYDRDIGHLHRTFLPELERRLGAEIRDLLTRRNVLRAFGTRAQTTHPLEHPAVEPMRRR